MPTIDETAQWIINWVVTHRTVGYMLPDGRWAYRETEIDDGLTAITAVREGHDLTNYDFGLRPRRRLEGVLLAAVFSQLLAKNRKP